MRLLIPRRRSAALRPQKCRRSRSATPSACAGSTPSQRSSSRATSSIWRASNMPVRCSQKRALGSASSGSRNASSCAARACSSGDVVGARRRADG